MDRSLALRDGAVLDARSLDRIIHALVFFSDRVAIRASYQISGHDNLDSADLEWKVDALRELGLVELWAHEYEVDDGGFAYDPTDSAMPRRPADRVLEQASFAASVNDMDGFLRVARERAYRDSATADGTLRQGTAEIVGFRSELMSVVISSELNQDGLLTNPATRQALRRGGGLYQSNDTFSGAVVRDVVEKLQLGPLWQLDAEAIAECRKFTADFRKLLDESLIAVSRGDHPVLTPEAVGDTVVSKYREILAQYGRLSGAQELGGEAAWDLLASAVPPSMFAKYGFKLFGAARRERELRPFLLLAHLERERRSSG